jgi:hypothetical protein
LFIVSPVRDDHRRFQAETPLIDLFKFAEPTLFAAGGYFMTAVASAFLGIGLIWLSDFVDAQSP